jgi:hypothetical protein
MKNIIAQAFALMEGTSTRIYLDGWAVAPILSQRVARKECAIRRVSWRYVKKLWQRGDTQVIVKGTQYKIPMMGVSARDGEWRKAVIIDKL